MGIYLGYSRSQNKPPGGKHWVFSFASRLALWALAGTHWRPIFEVLLSASASMFIAFAFHASPGLRRPEAFAVALAPSLCPHLRAFACLGGACEGSLHDLCKLLNM